MAVPPNPLPHGLWWSESHQRYIYRGVAITYLRDDTWQADDHTQVHLPASYSPVASTPAPADRSRIQSDPEPILEDEPLPHPEELLNAPIPPPLNPIETHLQLVEDYVAHLFPTTIPAPVTKMSHSNVKVNKPESYDGDRSKYRSFSIACALSIAVMDKPTDEETIVFTLSYLTKGSAAMWCDRYVIDTLPSTLTYTDFKKALDKAFEDGNAAANAMIKLKELKQGQKMADEYTAMFKALIGETSITEDVSIIDLYQTGLNGPLVDKCYSVLPTLKTFEEWVNAASQFDLSWRHRQSMKKGKTAYALSPRTSTRDPNAMDVDKKNTSTRLKKLTDQERKRLMEENRCFACREKGHMAATCPAKKTWRPQDAKKGKGKMREMEEEDADETEPDRVP